MAGNFRPLREFMSLRDGMDRLFEDRWVSPGNWLTWSGRGIYGSTRYACGEHRGDLKADLRETYGTVGRHPWAKGPHPWAGRRGTDRARRLARSLGSTFGSPG